MSPALHILILTFNRRDALTRTLAELDAQGWLERARVTVVDNGSGDGTGEFVENRWPRVRLLQLPSNVGVAAFNRAAEAVLSEEAQSPEVRAESGGGEGESAEPYLLILDDDAWPTPGTLERAAEVLGSRTDLGAVTLMPVHPVSERTEWPQLDRARDDWPFMGCANLVRASDWTRVGGYEESFFLYRNDTDLALKLLAAGRGVHADPALVALHDSPAAARKSERWLYMATRNWCWVARRHGRGAWKWAGMLMGALWALGQAGVSPGRMLAVMRGVREGAFGAKSALPVGVPRDGRGFTRAVGLQIGSVGRRG